MSATSGPTTSASTFLRGFLVAFVPLALLFLPLPFHRSSDAVVATYSGAYLVFLGVCGVAVVAVSFLIGAVSARRGTCAPAYVLLLVIVVVVAAGAVSEIVLTYRLRLDDSFATYAAWGHKRSMLFGFEAAPNNRWTNAGATYSTDEFGFRRHVSDETWSTKPGTRIFTLGESSVFGYGLNDDQTWPHLVEQKLRARLGDQSLDVINAGNNGFTSLQTLFRFYVRVLPLKPTYVVLYEGPNDITVGRPDRLLISEHILFSGSVVEFWARETEGQNFYARTLLYYVLVQRIPALQDLRSWLGATVSLGGLAHAADDAEEREAMETVGAGYAANLRTICLIAKANGVTPVLATFLQAVNPAYDGGRPQRMLDHNNALVRQLARDEHIPLIDLAATFDRMPAKASYFFADGYHPNTKGAEFVAATIAAAWPGTVPGPP